MENTEDLWQIIPNQTKNQTTNCIMPKYLLTNALKSDTIKLPLLFKITNTQTNTYCICISDEFFDTEEGEKLVMLPTIITNYLNTSELVNIEMINKSPDLIPPVAKIIYIEPQDEFFYKINNPKKTLEDCFKCSAIMGQNYYIPLITKTKTILLRVAKLADENGKELRFANITNIDLNVEFMPLPPQLTKNNIIRKKKKKIAKTNLKIPSSEPQKPIFDPTKKWVPFCGWGRVLSTGEYKEGVSQPD